MLNIYVVIIVSIESNPHPMHKAIQAKLFSIQYVVSHSHGTEYHVLRRLI